LNLKSSIERFQLLPFICLLEVYACRTYPSFDSNLKILP
jgi:hypothetical protein